MFKNLTPQWWLGLLTGLIMPVFGIMLVLDARPELVGIQQYAEGASADIVKHVNVQIITLGMIINAGLFFLFLKLNRDEMSRGLLFISVIWLIVIFIYRFLL